MSHGKRFGWNSILLALAFVVGIAAPARADYTYTFTYAANPGTAIHSFSFSFTVPAIITAPPDSSPAFTPFSVTDGTNSWTVSENVVGFSGIENEGCFGFRSATNASIGADGCGWAASNGGGVFTFNFAGGLPSGAGHYLPNVAGGAFVSNNGSTNDAIAKGFVNVPDTGTFALDIASSTLAVPEPCSLLLLGSGLSAALLRRQRPAGTVKTRQRPLLERGQP
jgi:hypothetical protein